MKTRLSILACLLMIVLTGVLVWQPWRKGAPAVTGAEGREAGVSRTGRAPNNFFNKAAWAHQRLHPNSNVRPESTSKSTQPLLSLAGDPRFPYRLKNTAKSDSELFASESAILLRNAHIETSEPVENLQIPKHLKSEGDPGRYIVQAIGRIDRAFRDVLRGARAEVISYVPHNAYLVKASAATVRQLQISPRVQGVVPYEPYYKYDATLLPLAVQKKALPQGKWLKIALHPGEREKGKLAIESLGAEVVSEDSYPFGHLLTIRPASGSLVALGQLPEVQLVEAYHERVLLTDLARFAAGVSSNTTATANHLGLTGNGVLVGVNGSGIDQTHPDLTGRITTDAAAPLADSTGHETLVAGILAGSGASSGAVTPTNGSVAGASYRGMAPSAELYPLGIVGASAEPVLDANGVILSANIISGAAGYVTAPGVSVLDATGSNAVLSSTITGGRVTAITVLSGGTNYSTNAFITMPAPWLDSQIITNIARLTNVYIVNNSWANFSPDYDSSSVLWDQAVRDSMPHWPGDQAITYVFSAGNSGGGTRIGNGGRADSILSPANAKNVIAVGALENLRTMPVSTTNVLYADEESDSADQVANFSSRGNTGAGIEGDYGRIKPDLVAPGTWVAGPRASGLGTNLLGNDNDVQLGTSLYRYESGTSMAAPVVSGILALLEEYFRDNQNRTNSPALNKALLINGARSASSSYDFNPRPSINYQGWGLPGLTNILPGIVGGLTNIGGTASGSMVYLDESGQVTNRLATGQTHFYDLTLTGDATNFPLRVSLVWTDPPGNPAAGIKLVNDLDLQVRSPVVGGPFYEGNFIPSGSQFNVQGATNQSTVLTRDFVNNVENCYIQGPHTNTGGATYRIAVYGNRVNVNSVTTDTNDVVQDYALVVSTEFGNTISLAKSGVGDLWTNRPFTSLTNGIPLNNERVGANFQRVTVNTNGVTNQWSFYVFGVTNPPYSQATNLVTNIIGTSTNILTNIIALQTNAGSNIAFSTFLPPNLARARNREADIDMYVTTDSGLTNLDPAVINATTTLRSTNRGGFEIITMDTGTIGSTFFIGIKSEDQQAATYGLLALSTDVPFAQTNTNGFYDIQLFPIPSDIPDGSPDSPQGIDLFGIVPYSTNVSGVMYSNTIVHQNIGDLSGTMVHNGIAVTMFNHNIAAGPGALRTNLLYYDSSGRNPDGPGELIDFIGQEAAGVWLISIVDDAPNHTGYVQNATLSIGSRTNYNQNSNRYSRTITLASGDFFVDFFYVPVSATNMRINLQGLPNPDPTGNGVDMFVRYGQPPVFFSTTITNFDAMGNPTNIVVTNVFDNSNGLVTSNLNNTILPDHMRVGQDTSPALTPGTWWFRINNNISSNLTLTLVIDLEFDLTTANYQNILTNVNVPLLDDYTTNTYIDVPPNRFITGIDVGMSILHPRVSDLVVHIINPAGDKVLLIENRGGNSSNLFANFTENTNYATSIITNETTGGMLHFTNLVSIKAVPAPFTNLVTPPLLLNSNDFVASGRHFYPRGSDISGSSLIIAGRSRPTTVGATLDDGHLVNFELPTLSNTVTRVWDTNWPGDLPQGRNDPAESNTVFYSVAASPAGYVAAGVTRDYFLTAQNPNGGFEPDIYDLDANCTNGTFTVNYTHYTVPDTIQIEYAGVVLTNTGQISGSGSISVNFSGSSSFLRVTMNPGSGIPGTAWRYSVNVTCNSTVDFAVNTFVTSGSVTNPTGMKFGPDGNLYVADTDSHVIRRITPAGVVSIFAGTNGTSGSLDGDRLTNAMFNGPTDIAFDAATNLYVVDSGNHTIRIIDTNGTVSVFAGTTGTQGTNTGVGTAAEFDTPWGIVVDSQTNIFVTDSGSHTIRLINPLTTNVTDFAGAPTVSGTTDNAGPLARLNNPRGIAIDSFDRIYVADTGNHIIRSVNTNGGITNFAGMPTTSGSANGTGTAASFNAPQGIAVSGGGTVYVADTGNHIVRQISPSAVVITAAGLAGNTGTTDGNGSAARFNGPAGMAVNNFGEIFIADSGNDLIRKMANVAGSGDSEKAIAVFYANTGPDAVTGGAARNGAFFLSRGLTNNVYNIDRDDRFFDVVTSLEGGTNYYYAVGSAKFSLGSENEKMFVTKFRTNGLALWTAGDPVAVGNQRLAAAVATVTAGVITAVTITDPGAGYAISPTAPPTVTIVDDGGTPTSVASVTVAIDGVGQVDTTVTISAGGSGYVSPRIIIDPPPGYFVNQSVGLGVALAYNTNVIVAGYTNESTGLTVLDRPYLRVYESNGVVRFAGVNTTSAGGAGGRYHAVTVVGTNIIAVGRTAGFTSDADVDSLIERWDLAGNFLGSTNLDLGVGTSYDELNDVLGFECPDRIYAIGTRTNGSSTDAFMLEIDVLTLAPISTNFLTDLTVLSTGDALSTDGNELYATIGVGTTRRARILRYRIKNWYLPEESLNHFIGTSTSLGTNSRWRLQVWDNRAEGTNGTSEILCWNLNLQLAAANITPIFLDPGQPFFGTLLGTAPTYFVVNSPSAAQFVTNVISGNNNLTMTYNRSGFPVGGKLDNVVLLDRQTSGRPVMSTNTAASLYPGGRYYLEVRNAEGVSSNSYSIKVDYDRVALPIQIPEIYSGVLTSSFVNPGPEMAYYRFTVPANATGAKFEMTPNLGNLDLYLRRDRGATTLPSVSIFDYRSIHPFAGKETLFVVPDSSSSIGLIPGTWFVGVANPGSQSIFATLLATAFTGDPYNVITATSGAPNANTSVVGNAPDKMFKLNVSGAPKSLLFEVVGQSGNGDLIVRQGLAPAGTNFTAAAFTLGTANEIVVIRTNAGPANLNGDWYFGVRNREVTNLTYTAVARMPVGGLLLSEQPIQLLGLGSQGLLQPNGGFGFTLGVVPGETYQIQYASNAVSTNWLVLTNIVAPPNGQLDFTHTNALTNDNLYYRIQQVP